MDEANAPPDLQKVLAEAFAPWIRQLNIQIGEITATGGKFSLPENPDIARSGGIICGQAIASVADTVGVLCLVAHNKNFRPLTTVDMTTHFMRPLMNGDVDITVTLLSNGRRMATARIEFRASGSSKICATATCAYAYLDGV